ncbi:MAG: VOC family protein [Chitinophagaceae bacterium]
MTNSISWYEIPTSNIDRAVTFYETIMSISLIPMDMSNLKMRVFPVDDMMSGVTGVLVYSEDGFHKPSSTDGPLIYLNANSTMPTILEKVESAGGKIIVPRTQISPEHGYMAIIIDSEGNRIAFHSID